MENERNFIVTVSAGSGYVGSINEYMVDSCQDTRDFIKLCLRKGTKSIPVFWDGDGRNKGELKMDCEKMDIEDTFTYHPPKEGQPTRYEAIRAKAKELAFVIMENTPCSADQSAAIRKLRECVMTANASIALEK